MRLRQFALPGAPFRLDGKGGEAVSIYLTATRQAIAEAAAAGLSEAGMTLQRHGLSFADGNFRECGMPTPCDSYEQAAAVFKVTLALPRRVPGASRPHLVGTRRIHAGSTPSSS